MLNRWIKEISININPRPKNAKYKTYLKASFFGTKNLAFRKSKGRKIKKNERIEVIIKMVIRINTEYNYVIVHLLYS